MLWRAKEKFMKQTAKKSGGMGKGVAVGAGVLALGAAAYLFFGPNGKQNRQKARSWMLGMKSKVVEQLESLEEVTEPIYNKIVDTVAATYGAAQSIDKSELKEYVKMLKDQWKDISKSVKGSAKSAKRTAKSPAKKAKSKTASRSGAAKKRKS